MPASTYTENWPVPARSGWHWVRRRSDGRFFVARYKATIREWEILWRTGGSFTPADEFLDYHSAIQEPAA